MPHELTIHWDCRHYRGDKPCRFNRLCAGCDHHAPYRGRIAIVKIGALGDVIRTLCILPELRRRHPDAHITWITSRPAAAFLASHHDIDRIVPFEPLASLPLLAERFDTLISLDKEPAPCGFAMALHAETKLGIGLSPAGTAVPLNPQAHDYFSLGLSDELKFHRNTLSYPQLLYHALGWDYRGQRYFLPLTPAADQAVRQRLTTHLSPSHPILGVNVGAGRVFANKMFPASFIADVLRKLHDQQPNLQVLLLGGSDEAQRMDELHALLPWTIHTRSDNLPDQFLALIDRCDTLLTGDTLAMHLALARSRAVVAFFGPTCHQEIDLFGLGEKLVAKTPCSPCYKSRCDQRDACLHAISIDQTVDTVNRVLRRSTPQPIIQPLRQAG